MEATRTIMPDQPEPPVGDPQPDLLTRREGAVLYLTLNRPGAYNALSLDLMRRLIAALRNPELTDAAACVVIAGSGPGFSAGHDLREVQGNPDPAFREDLFTTCATMMQAVREFPRPVIASVHGVATAAGCQLVAGCDLALAADDARFGVPGVNIGLFCSTPMVALSRAVAAKQAMEMLLTGELISAQKALDIGLVNRIVPATALEDETAALAARIGAKSLPVLETGKAAFYRQIAMPVEQAYDHCAGVMVQNLELADAGEGIAAFLDKRPPVWRHR